MLEGSTAITPDAAVPSAGGLPMLLLQPELQIPTARGSLDFERMGRLHGKAKIVPCLALS